MTETQPVPGEGAVPLAGRLLGIDFGTRRIGFAICNAEQSIASPLDNYTRRSVDLDARHVRNLVAENRIVGLVVGLPVHMSGAEGGTARQVRQFADWLQQITKLPVEFADERFTSAMAEEYLMGLEMTKKQRQARLDKLAAQLILQSYLERRGQPIQDLRNR